MKNISKKDKKASVSLIGQGTRFQFELAFVLVSLIPLLAIVVLHNVGIIYIEMLDPVIWIVAGFLIMIACLGYALLGKYPRAIMRIRDYLEQVAGGEVPEAVDLLVQERDIEAIEQNFRLVVDQMKDRLNTIREQQEKLLEAERQKVMVESLCTACHHLGQPATAITCYLSILQQEDLSANASENLNRCIEEAGKLRDVLGKLQMVDQYSTDQYCPDSEDDDSQKILKVDGDKALRQVPWEKIQRGLEAFCRAYAEIEKGYDVGTVVQLNNRSIGLVCEKNEKVPSEPIVQIALDAEGNHPDAAVRVDLSQDKSLAISRTLHAVDKLHDTPARNDA